MIRKNSSVLSAGLLALALVNMMPVAATARLAPVTACGPVYALGWQNAIGNPGLDSHVWALEGVDETSSLGPALYACGSFTTAGGNAASHVAKWDGTAWSPLIGPLGEGLGNECEDIRLGPDDRLYMTGVFTNAGGHLVNHVTAWDGTDFQSINSGLDHWGLGMEFHDPGGGTMLWLGGYFKNPTGQVGDTLSHLTSWDGTFWFIYGPGAGDYGADSNVWELREWDDGSGNTLYVAGQFTSITGNTASRIAKLSGATFVPLAGGLLGGGSTPVQALMPYDDGSGSKLYAGGNIYDADGVAVDNIASWNGSSWTDVGGGVNGSLEGLGVADVGDGSKLYALGYQTTAGTGAAQVNANGIASWDGNKWSRLLRGLTPAAGILDHGMFGEEWNGCLYAAGGFDHAGTLPAINIARWCCGISFLAKPYNVDIRRFLPVDFDFTDDGDGLPEKIHCGSTEFNLTAGSSITACGISVRVGTSGTDVIELSDVPTNAVVFAGSGNDQIRGTRFDDVIFGGAGDDVIEANEGNDAIMADAGNDTLYGGDGADQIAGSQGNDELIGGNGDDVLAGNEDEDLIDGGRGDDVVEGAEVITQDTEQRLCLLRLSGSASRIVKTQAALQRTCLRDAYRGDVADVDACDTVDPRGKIAKVMAALDSTLLQACAVAPDVAFSPPSTIVSASRSEPRGLLNDLLGTNADLAVAAAIGIEGGERCQLAVVQTASKLLLGEVAAFDKCAGVAGEGPLLVGSPFDGCYAAMEATPSSKLENLVDTLRDVVAQRCPSASISTLLPGVCASASDTAACVVERTLCRACRMLNARSQSGHDCDQFDNDNADASCS